jgi:hypothetical protein
MAFHPNKRKVLMRKYKAFGSVPLKWRCSRRVRSWRNKLRILQASIEEAIHESLSDDERFLSELWQSFYVHRLTD